METSKKTVGFFGALLLSCLNVKALLGLNELMDLMNILRDRLAGKGSRNTDLGNQKLYERDFFYHGTIHILEHLLLGAINIQRL